MHWQMDSVYNSQLHHVSGNLNWTQVDTETL